MEKILISAIVAVAFFTTLSCQKDSSSVEIVSVSSSPVFIARIESEADTKTTLTTEKKVCWEQTDKISVNGAVYVATPDLMDPTKATFIKESGTDPTGVFHAYFPSTIFDGTVGILPAVQTYEEGKLNAPMYAESTSASLIFKNICALLAVKVKNTDMASVRKIRVSSKNCAMRGDFSVTSNVAVLSAPTEISNNVILDCGESGVPTTAEGILFYIAIPAQSYRNIKIELSSDGINYTKSMITKNYVDIVTEANTLYQFDFAEMPVYPECPTMACFKVGDVWWAPVNCGYTEEYSYGLLYQWGRKVGAEYNVAWTAPTSHDAETQLQAKNNSQTANPDDGSIYYGYQEWYNGSTPINSWPLKSTDSGYLENKIDNPCPDGWRVPTHDEFNQLLGGNATPSRVVLEDQRGAFFNGTATASIENGLFFPYAGYRIYDTGDSDKRGSLAYYWASDNKSATKAYVFESYNNSAKLSNYVHGGARSVRCVLE